MSINGSYQSSSRGSADRECTSFSSKVLLTSSTASNHTADDTDESVMRRWSQKTCVFSTDVQKGGRDALTDPCIHIHLKEDKQRWVRSACASQSHNGIRVDPLCFLTDVINESENCCDARGIAFPRHFFLPCSFVSYVKALQAHPQRPVASKARVDQQRWKLAADVPPNFPVIYRTMRITEKLSSARWKH